eukprot:CAMPEP_0183600266 /NCGR_PEP_ID=MMETSP0371-20130417/179847_1 /TAXON_ID=268820 /ORGANISM="Peridinium aciculiferum, Strain PAER-2" /LENGTH=447 /DNA_ID=CAMNT_0025812339 /DNA_START=87 /DNA_END=1431 /DNA_ORIENTATION=-
MAEGRVYNFSAGPSMMPLEVLEEMQKEFVNYKGCGMSIMEMSHRGKEFTQVAKEADKNMRDIFDIPDNYKVLFLQGGATVAKEADKNMRDIFDIPDNYKVLFLQGGATLQFSTVPLNVLGGAKTKADYLVTGQWSDKAQKECEKYGTGQVACSSKPTKFTTIPDKSEWKLDPEAAYVHYCMNETVNGVEFNYTPDVGDVPLIADMSSDFCSKPIDVRKHAYIYAGVQKNLGPSGLAVGILRDDFADGKREMKVCPTYCSWKTTADNDYAYIYAGVQKNLGPSGLAVGILRDDFADGKREMKICPTYCSWKTTADNDSMYNTPACYTLYAVGEYLKYTKQKGGLPYWDEISDKKSRMLYDTIDGSDGFYQCPVQKNCRSRMNVPFTIMGGHEALEKKFLADATKVKLYTLAGHRSVGGCRASLYNGMPVEGVEKLMDFMKSFMDENRK